jgi:hypothetical protein
MFMIPANLRYATNRDGAVILDVSNNAIIPLNSTGAYIWQRLERGMLLDDIVTELARETDTDREIVAADVGRFMENLKSQRLVLGA